LRYISSGKDVVWSKFNVDQIKEQMPADSWWIRHSRVNEELVWVHDGDLTLEFLDLDWQEESLVKEPSLLLIRGKLTVTGSISNENTDGVISLMVLGDLEAGHMAVGGQEVYVAGCSKIQDPRSIMWLV